MNQFPKPAFALLLLLLVPAVSAKAAPSRWSCAEDMYGDSICDCGCGADDSDCEADERFIVCETSACPSGSVPWEHSPSSCMTSACGDGWVDLEAGELCDDGNALASGGCNSDCTEVNDGYACGERAEGCQVAEEEEPPAADAGLDSSDNDAGGDTAFDSDAGAGDTSAEGAPDSSSTGEEDDSGCSTTTGNPGRGSLAGLVALAMLLTRRRRAA